VRRRKSNIRDDFLKQERYIKYMRQAESLWDSFTAGNAKQKKDKLLEQINEDENERGGPSSSMKKKDKKKLRQKKKDEKAEEETKEKGKEL